ncbi:MAG: hypothetical protein Q8M01_14230 [Rubrivivax sp.]|nr:hypothetical protein [Rubrivivax sp.]
MTGSQQRAPAAAGVAVTRHDVDHAVAGQGLLGGLLHGQAVVGVDGAAHEVEVDAVRVFAHAHDTEGHGVEEDTPRGEVDAPHRHAGQHQCAVEEFGAALGSRRAGRRGVEPEQETVGQVHARAVHDHRADPHRHRRRPAGQP